MKLGVSGTLSHEGVQSALLAPFFMAGHTPPRPRSTHHNKPPPSHPSLHSPDLFPHYGLPRLLQPDQVLIPFILGPTQARPLRRPLFPPKPDTPLQQCQLSPTHKTSSSFWSWCYLGPIPPMTMHLSFWAPSLLQGSSNPPLPWSSIDLPIPCTPFKLPSSS